MLLCPHRALPPGDRTKEPRAEHRRFPLCRSSCLSCLACFSTAFLKMYQQSEGRASTLHILAHKCRCVCIIFIFTSSNHRRIHDLHNLFTHAYTHMHMHMYVHMYMICVCILPSFANICQLLGSPMTCHSTFPQLQDWCKPWTSAIL